MSLKSNVTALTVQRMFARNTTQLEQSFTRLSTGMRINRAVDDAAGLAIASSLRADTRVYTQGIRNLNDGISLTNIADGALAELSNIVTRIQELATQAANGTYTDRQRQPLDTEADELVEEYNRILSITNFNGKNLLAGSPETFRIQAGYGTDESLSFVLGEELSRTTGDGTFQSEVTTSSNASRSIALGDINGDSILDIVSVENNSGGRARVKTGNGDGTFTQTDELNLTSNSPQSVEFADVNNDGNLDVISISSIGTDLDVFLGVGDGTFGAAINRDAGNSQAMAIGDLNGDGNIDIATVTNTAQQDVKILLGQGNGSFTDGTLVSYSGNAVSIEMQDLNNDGRLDLIVGEDDSNDVNDLHVFMGNGNATFQSGVTYAAGVGTTGDGFALTGGDFNNDGNVDIAAVGDGYLSVFLGNGDGTLQSNISHVTTVDRHVRTADINGDGNLDLAMADTGALVVRLGQGDGNFGSETTLGTPSPSNDDHSLRFGDLNGDGAQDIAVADSSNVEIEFYLGNTQQVTNIDKFNLTTQASARAAIDEVEAILNRVTLERGKIGAAQSRLNPSLRNTGLLVENYTAAQGTIMDADVATESSKLVRTQILQQAGAAVLTQAQQLPALALSLLSP